MKTPIDPDIWNRAATARRKVVAATPAEDESPPPGFSTRIAARWAELRQNETARLWGRWSLRAALGGLLTAAIMALFSPAQPAGGALQAPQIEMPSFSSR